MNRMRRGRRSPQDRQEGPKKKAIKKKEEIHPVILKNWKSSVSARTRRKEKTEFQKQRQVEEGRRGRDTKLSE